MYISYRQSRASLFLYEKAYDKHTKMTGKP